MEDELIETRTKYILKGKIKKFDSKLYNKYDIPARTLVKEKLGNNVKDNPNIYEEDLIIDNNECRYKFIEIQVCGYWDGINNYPFKNAFVFERKGHFSDNTLFIIFDRNLKKGLLFDKKSLKKEPRRYKPYSRLFVYETVGWYKILQFCCENLNFDLINAY